MKKEFIGAFMGKEIHLMNREELFEFAKWAAKRMEYLETIERSTADFRIRKEIGKPEPKPLTWIEKFVLKLPI